MNGPSLKHGQRFLCAAVLSISFAPVLHAQQSVDNGQVTDGQPSKTGDKAKPAEWADAITVELQVQGGAMKNPANPSDGQNFGQLFSDKDGKFLLNHTTLTFQRPTDPDATGYDFGFFLQGSYGSNARYNHVLGIDDYLLKGRNQLIPTSLYATAHLPWLTKGGIDVKAGILPAMMGYEAFDPTVRAFYTYSYISNYIIPFWNTGGQATWHVDDTLDFYVGADTGNQTSFGNGDNNRAAAGYFGFGLNKLLDGKLNIIVMSRLGPEVSKLQYANADYQVRSWNDIIATYKYDDQLSFAGEGSLVYDRALPNHTAYGFAAYAAYAYTKEFTFNLRAEIMRDNTNQLVGNYIGNTDYVKSLYGLSSNFVTSSGPTTFSAFSFNVAFKRKFDRAQTGLPFKYIQIRPEIRYEHALNGPKPYNAGKSREAFMFGGDVVLGF